MPFKEDGKDPCGGFFYHKHHRSMLQLFHGINGTSETCCFDFLYVYFATMFLTKILFFSDMVGWYSTGPELRDNDLDVHAQFCHYAPYPVLVVINVGLGIPTNSYYTMSSLEVTHILFLTIYILYIFNHLDCILLLFRKSRKKSLFVRL